MKMLYVAGPVSGVPEYNIPAFRAATSQLMDVGYYVLSPIRHAETYGVNREWAFYMRLGIADLMRCQGVACLPGWEKSRGANIEIGLAKDLGIDVRPPADWVALKLTASV